MRIVAIVIIVVIGLIPLLVGSMILGLLSEKCGGPAVA